MEKMSMKNKRRMIMSKMGGRDIRIWRVILKGKKKRDIHITGKAVPQKINPYTQPEFHM